MITIGNHSINPDWIAHIHVHSVGSGRYEPLLPATRTALDIRAPDGTLTWTRIFDSPEEALVARDVVLRAIGAGKPMDLKIALNDWNLPD